MTDRLVDTVSGGSEICQTDHSIKTIIENAMVKYIIGEANDSGEMEVHCATTKQRLGTLHLKNGKYRYGPVGTSIEVGEYTYVIRQHRSEQLMLVRQAA